MSPRSSFISLILVFSLQAHALTADEFAALTWNQQQNVLDGADIAEIDFADWTGDAELAQRFARAIEVVGTYVFDIWGDTILGGDYTELGSDFWIQDHKLILKNGTPIAAYAVVYNRAVDYGDWNVCNWDYFEANEEWNPECVELYSGVIREPFMTNVRGRKVWRDFWAEFVFDADLK
jgi:hypothetical protein